MTAFNNPLEGYDRSMTEDEVTNLVIEKGAQAILAYERGELMDPSLLLIDSAHAIAVQVMASVADIIAQEARDHPERANG